MEKLEGWTGIRLEVAEYCRDHQIPENDFRFLCMNEWQNVYEKVLDTFVDGKYARSYGLHWANVEGGFKEVPEYSFRLGCDGKLGYEWLKKIPEIIQSDKVYLLLEESGMRAKYWIAECNPKVIECIINDTYLSDDYFIVDKKYKWMITENHHEIVQFIGAAFDGTIIDKIVSC